MSNDPLPEQTAYRDTGCRLHAACLTCPFVRCKEDEPRVQYQTVIRVERFLVLRRQGKSVKEAAFAVGLSQRSGYRIARYARERERRAA